MNKIWVVLVGLSIACLLVFNPATVLPAMLKGTNDALSLTTSLLAIYTLWLGIMEILDATGLSTKISYALRPVIKLLFPNISEDATRYITLNLAVNILGAGGAATPLGIKAVKEMDDLSGVATSNIILFVVINSTSLQLIPTTVLGLRSASGSASPADIVVIGIISQMVSTIFAVVLCKILVLVGKKRQNLIVNKKNSGNKDNARDNELVNEAVL